MIPTSCSVLQKLLITTKIFIAVVEKTIFEIGLNLNAVLMNFKI